MNARPPKPSASSSASSLKNSTIFRKFSASLLRRKFTHPAWNPMRTKAGIPLPAAFPSPWFLYRAKKRRDAGETQDLGAVAFAAGEMRKNWTTAHKYSDDHDVCSVPGGVRLKRRRSGMEAIRDSSDVSGHPLHRHSRQSASHRAFVAGTFAELTRTLLSTVTTALWVVWQTLSGCLSGGTHSWHA